MKYNQTWSIVLLCFILYLLVSRLIIMRFLPEIDLIPTKMEVTTSASDKRLEALEPSTPMDLSSYDLDSTALPTDLVSVEKIMADGQTLALQYVYQDAQWERPVYKTYWHSSELDGAFSYVPTRLYYAMHQIFATYPTATDFQTLIHHLGLVEESQNFELYDHIYDPYHFIYLVVLNYEIHNLSTLGNQILVSGDPSLTGLQVIVIPINSLTIDENEPLLFQLATTEGDLLDTTRLKNVATPTED